jgi:hypothetical protein
LSRWFYKIFGFGGRTKSALIVELDRPPFQMTTARKELKTALEVHLLPVFTQRGFTGPSALNGHNNCYYFHRQEGDSYKFLAIQFEKRGGPQFRVNFSEATREDLQQRCRFAEAHLGRPAVLEDVLSVPWGVLRGHLHPSRLPYFKLFTWFDARKAGAPEIAARVVALYPEIEAWWRERKVGPHLWIPDLVGRRRKHTLTRLRDGTHDA